MRGLRQAWNKGQTKHTDPRIADYAKKLSTNPKCIVRGKQLGERNKGRKISKEHKRALDDGRRKKRSEKFTEDQKTYICNLYLTPLNFPTVEKISGVSTYWIKKILSERNIKEHSKEIRNKIMTSKCAETKTIKYGDPHYTNVEQRVETLSAKDDVYWKARKQKVKNTFIEHYGVDNCFKSPKIKDKIRETKLDKYGNETFNNRKKASETCLAKYGVENYSQSFSFPDNYHFRRYQVNDVHLDSFPELCVYLYYINKGASIERNGCRFPYVFEGHKHYCFVDFVIDGRLVEVKGDYLYSRMLIPNTSDNEKLKCLRANNVEIWTSEVYNKYIKWFKDNNFNEESYKKE